MTGTQLGSDKDPQETTQLCIIAQSCLTLCDPMDCSPPGTSVHGDSPGKNTRVSSHVLLQGISPTQGENPGLLFGRRILYHLSHQGSPLYWSGYLIPFSRGSFPLRNRTRVSCLAGRFWPPSQKVADSQMWTRLFDSKACT